MDIWRELDEKEVKEFKEWADENYTKGDEINDCWHPVVKERCKEINDRKGIVLNYHGVMLTDYFHGTSGVMLSIHITPETTHGEVLDMLKDETEYYWDMIDSLDPLNKDLDDEVDDKIKEMRDYCEQLGSINEPLCPDMDYDEDDENACAIFSIEAKDE
jgi:hypothetical protein